MDLLEVIGSRRSCRAFEDRPVPRELIERILEASKRSPSYSNTQPWGVAVVSGAARGELAKALYTKASAKAPTNPDLPTPVRWPEAMAKRAQEHNSRRLAALGIAMDDEEEKEKYRLSNFNFYGAPCVLVFHMDASLGPWSKMDMGMFIESVILAAEALGLGTVPQASVVGYPEVFREKLGIPKDHKVLMALALGYPDRGAPINSYVSTRIKVEDFTQWHGF